MALAAGEARALSPEWRKRAIAWLRPAFALGLLAFGASLVPWKDHLVWMRGRETLEVPGRIHGSWRDETVRFQTEPGTLVDPRWPADLSGALASGQEIAVARSPEDSAGDRIDWKPGMLRVFREVEPAGLWSALLLILCGALVAITRWWRLLAVAGCRMPWTSALRLSFLGFFFNLVLPAGITGGDVVKAVLVVRENPGRRADALVTVIVDRALGLLVLMGIAAAVVLAAGPRFAELRVWVVMVFLAALLALWILLHPGPRRWMRVSALIERLPQKDRLKSVDQALRIYSEHPLELAIAVLLSAVNHTCIGACVYQLAHAFGDHLSFFEYLGVAAIANTISSVPVTPAGWGVGEWAFGSLFHLLGSSSTVGVAVSVAYRLLSTLVGLVGGLFLLMPGGRVVRREIGRIE